MKSLSIFETPEELELLKKRVIAGEAVYTVIDGKTVLLLPDNQAKLVSKREVDNIVSAFPFPEAEEGAEAQAAQGSEESAKAAEPYARLIAVEARLDAIEAALSTPILAKPV